MARPELKEKILRMISNHSIYTIEEIKQGYKTSKSIDILIMAIDRVAEQNISLYMAIFEFVKRTKEMGE